MSDNSATVTMTQLEDELAKAGRPIVDAADKALAEGTLGKEETLRRMRAALDADA